MRIKENDKIIIPNFSETEPHDLFESELGWGDGAADDAHSDDPEAIFRYYIDIVGFNIAFYYVDDGCFYSIFTEEIPINVIRKFKDPNWDGKFIIDSVIGAVDTYAPGDIIYSTDDASKIWNELKIGGKSIGEVLERSVIMTFD